MGSTLRPELKSVEATSICPPCLPVVPMAIAGTGSSSRVGIATRSSPLSSATANYGWGSITGTIITSSSTRTPTSNISSPGAYRDNGLSNVYEHVYSRNGVTFQFAASSSVAGSYLLTYGRPGFHRPVWRQVGRHCRHRANVGFCRIRSPDRSKTFPLRCRHRHGPGTGNGLALLLEGGKLLWSYHPNFDVYYRTLTRSRNHRNLQHWRHLRPLAQSLPFRLRIPWHLRHWQPPLCGVVPVRAMIYDDSGQTDLVERHELARRHPERWSDKMTTINWNEESGALLSAEHQRIARVIHDYDPTLELAWIPPEARQLTKNILCSDLSPR